MEAMAKGVKERPDTFPRIFTCPNEMVALSMADGYARVTSEPQCVIIHVDVGTSGLGAAIHNAATGRAPVLIFAGLSPFTLDGEMRGSRTEYMYVGPFPELVFLPHSRIQPLAARCPRPETDCCAILPLCG
jgi:hypothetical protein